MNNLYCLFFVILNFYASAQRIKADRIITYEFPCMEEVDFDTLINFSSDLEKEILLSAVEKVSINEEVRWGKKTLKKLKKDYFFDESSSTFLLVNAILSNLIANINNPMGYTYELYLMNTDEVNAHTVGGKIFVSRGIIDFCVSIDEIAFILAHEIAHNELGHVRDRISRFYTAQQFYYLVEDSVDLASILTSPFDQKDEVHCDLVGVDLTISSGYKSCSGVDLCARMDEKEKFNNWSFTKFDSHPDSAKRVACLKHHLKENYNVTCE